MNLQIQKNNSKLDWINLESDEASLQVPLSFLDNFFLLVFSFLLLIRDLCILVICPFCIGLQTNC